MKFNNTQVFNFEGAFRGMRNPLESWNKSDSFFGIINWINPQDAHEDVVDAWTMRELVQKQINVEPYSKEWEEVWNKYSEWLYSNECLQDDNDLGVVATLGPNDLTLAQKLILAGPEHSKFMRQIFVSVDITAPIYWWKEFDTYKIGTTANSTSTMHKLTSAPITIGYFETDDYNGSLYVPRVDQSEVTEYGQSQDFEAHWHTEILWDNLIEHLEDLRQAINAETDATNKKALWKELVRILPQGWLQTRTITMSYANLRNIYFQRRDHKLVEWHKFCDWIKTLPYSEELIILEDTNETN